MIRDEFKNADKKTIKSKVKETKISGNEREYYAKKMTTINDLFRPVKVSTLVTLICFALPSIMYLLCVLFVADYKVEWHCIAVLAFEAVMIVWTVVWFAFLAPHLRRRAAFYKAELERISREYVLKRMGKF